MAMNELELAGERLLFAPVVATQIDAMVLAAGVAETYTLPSGCRYVMFSADGDFYARYAGTAAVPTTEVTDGTGAELNPAVRYVGDQTTISVIASATTIVTICAYK